MTRSERIEAAASLAMEFGLQTTNAEMERILNAAYPELAAGTHWIAPMEATEVMGIAGNMQMSAEPVAEAIWAAMRDAHLSPDKEDNGE